MDRQRIILLFAAAWVSAGLLSWFLYANTIAPRADARTAVYAVTRDLDVGTMVKKMDLKKIQVLPKDLPKGAVYAEKDIVGRAVLYPFAANEALVGTKLSKLAGAEGVPATIDAGMRAVAVQVTDVSGVAGLIQPNSRVDVIYTKPGNMAEAMTATLLENIKVLAFGRITQVGQVVDPKLPKMPVATLVVTPEQAQRLELAKNEGRISLSLRNPLDKSLAMNLRPVATDVLDPDYNARVERSRRRTAPLRSTQEVQRALQDAGVPAPPRPVAAQRKIESPPPRAVVEVFRGDKHVQEIFHD